MRWLIPVLHLFSIRIYFHYSGDNSNFVTGTNLNIINPIISLAGSIRNYASAKSEYDIDQVDVYGGQYINVGCRLILHPTMGLRWAQLERDITGTYIATTFEDDLTSITNTTSKETSDFNGIGAIVGLDATYYVVYGFGLVGHFDGGALVDNIQSQINTSQTISGIPTVTTNQFKSDDNIRVAPVVDAKLGVDYTYLLYNAANSDLTLEVGWQFSHYYRAADRIYANGVGSETTIIAHKTSDVGFNGPYAYLVFHI